jgi:hypothetical protein
MKRSLLYMLLIALALISLTSQSYAGDHGKGWDYKFLSGAACQPQFGAQVGDFDRDPFSIRNVSSEPPVERSVICPIVRDTVTEHDLDIGVTVTTGVKCSFQIMNFKGDQVSDLSPSDTQSVDVDRETQYFLVKADPNIDPDGFVGYYALYCTLPPDAQVFSYGSGELAETTDYGE